METGNFRYIIIAHNTSWNQINLATCTCMYGISICTLYYMHMCTLYGISTCTLYYMHMCTLYGIIVYVHCTTCTCVHCMCTLYVYNCICTLTNTVLHVNQRQYYAIISGNLNNLNCNNNQCLLVIIPVGLKL